MSNGWLLYLLFFWCALFVVFVLCCHLCLVCHFLPWLLTPNDTALFVQFIVVLFLICKSFAFLCRPPPQRSVIVFVILIFLQVQAPCLSGLATQEKPYFCFCMIILGQGPPWSSTGAWLLEIIFSSCHSNGLAMMIKWHLSTSSETMFLEGILHFCLFWNTILIFQTILIQ